jgi:hypothetical protein
MGKRNRIRIPHSTRLLLAAKQKYKCAQCEETLGPTWDVDHIIPLWKGGEDSIANMQVLCAGGTGNACHARKTEREMYEYIDIQRERRTGKSRFFDPLSTSHIEFFETFRFKGKLTRMVERRREAKRQKTTHGTKKTQKATNGKKERQKTTFGDQERSIHHSKKPNVHRMRTRSNTMRASDHGMQLRRGKHFRAPTTSDFSLSKE